MGSGRHTTASGYAILSGTYPSKSVLHASVLSRWCVEAHKKWHGKWMRCKFKLMWREWGLSCFRNSRQAGSSWLACSFMNKPDALDPSLVLQGQRCRHQPKQHMSFTKHGNRGSAGFGSLTINLVGTLLQKVLGVLPQ